MQIPLVIGQIESTSFRNLELVPKSILSAFIVRNPVLTKRNVNVYSLIRMNGGAQARYAFGAIQ